MANKIDITICKHTDGKSDTIETIGTGGYALFYLIGDTIKVIGDLDLKALAPLIMKIAMERMTKQ